MRKVYYLISFIIVTSCGTVERKGDTSKYTKNCTKIYKYDYSAYNIEDFRIVTATDTVILNQLKFFCVGGVSTGNIIYDDFGKWAYHYKLERNDKTMVWKDIDLIDDGKKYSVYTSGFDDQNGPPYTSVMVFDENDNDMLAGDSKMREIIINYFTEKIRSFDGSTDFLKELFITFYPNNWKNYLQQSIEYRNSL